MVLSDREDMDLISADENGTGGIRGAPNAPLSVEGLPAEDMVERVELFSERAPAAAGDLQGPSRVAPRSPSNSNEKPLCPGRTPVSKLLVVRIGGGDGVLRPFSLTGPSGGVLGNIGSAHSKCGVERPENIAESRKTLRPRGREYFP